MKIIKNQNDSLSEKDRKNQELLISEKLPIYLSAVGIGRMYWKVDENRLAGEEAPEVRLYAKQIKNKIEAGKGVILSGGVGCGKTTILSWYAQKAFEIGGFGGYVDEGKFIPQHWSTKFNVQFCSVSRFFNLTFERRFDKIDKYQDCDFLLLDDFGREYGSDFPISKFEDFIEERYANMKSTCVTTNLDRGQLKALKTYERTIDRWRDKKLFQFIELADKSQRG